MILLLRLFTRGARLLKRVKKSNVSMLAIYLDCGEPSLPALVPIHTLPTGRVVTHRSRIASILRGGCFPQIAQTIVYLVAIDVVDFSGRPLAIGEQPRNAVSLIFFGTDGDYDIAGSPMNMPGFAAFWHS